MFYTIFQFSLIRQDNINVFLGSLSVPLIATDLLLTPFVPFADFWLLSVMFLLLSLSFSFVPVIVLDLSLCVLFILAIVFDPLQTPVVDFQWCPAIVLVLLTIPLIVRMSVPVLKELLLIYLPKEQPLFLFIPTTLTDFFSFKNAPRKFSS